MRIYWATHHVVEAAGSAYGYTSASVNLLHAMSRHRDVEIATPDSAEVCVHFCHPVNFNPLPGARNVLFTMYEFDPLPQEFKDAARKADAIVVPSEFCRKLFVENIGCDTPVRVSQLGFDPEVWTTLGRSPGSHGTQPFTWLFAGDLNDRKGYHLVMEAWGAVFADVPGVSLYMKLSGEGPAEERKRIVRGNVTCDFRSLSRAEMVELFHGANAFVFPSMGEGWGLTAMEAAATGLPVVATRCGGVEDFLQHRMTWWVKTHRHPVRISPKHGGGVAFGVRAEPRDIALAMRDVMAQYNQALRMARKQARIMHDRFTWDDAAQSLVTLLDELSADRWAA